MGDAMDRIRAAEARSNAVIERTTELDRHITALERRLRAWGEWLVDVIYG